jgi:streptogramin lyase
MHRAPRTPSRLVLPGIASLGIVWSCGALKAADEEPPAHASVDAGPDREEASREVGPAMDVYEATPGEETSAPPDGGPIEEFTPPLDHTGVSGIVVGPDGAAWITDGVSGTIVRLTATGQATVRRLPGPFENGAGVAHPSAIIVGPDQNFWFIDRPAQVVARISRMTLDGVVTSFPMPKEVEPIALAEGPDGNLWYADNNGAPPPRVGRMTPVGDRFDSFELRKGWPFAISAGPDGNVWVAETLANALGRITPTGAVVEFELPTSMAEPASITAGPDGNVWFTEGFGIPRVGRIQPDGTIFEYRVQVNGSLPPSPVLYIRAGADGKIWFTETDRIASISTDDQTVTEYRCPLRCAPKLLAPAPDGSIWYHDAGRQVIARLTP